MNDAAQTYDVTALGEILVDFTPAGVGEQGSPMFQANPGGAPCNVLAMLARLGRRTAFIGKVGDDLFGHMLRARIRTAGIDDAGLVESGEARTTLAFVSIDEAGDRDFSFYRHPGADMMLRWDDIPVELLRRTRAFHFGTISMTHEGIRQVTREAVACARRAGALISFDPNLRPPLWQSLDTAREQMRYGCSQCDVLKIEIDELRFLTGKTELDEAVTALRGEFSNIGLVLVTAGAEGSFAFCGSLRAWQPTFLRVKTIDTTGAGDSFLGTCLSALLDHPPATLSEEDLNEMLLTANAAASLVTTRKGALASMPAPDEIRELLEGGL